MVEILGFTGGSISICFPTDSVGVTVTGGRAKTSNRVGRTGGATVAIASTVASAVGSVSEITMVAGEVEG